jgi:hypothetical protein
LKNCHILPHIDQFFSISQFFHQKLHNQLNNFKFSRLTAYFSQYKLIFNKNFRLRHNFS